MSTGHLFTARGPVQRALPGWARVLAVAAIALATLYLVTHITALVQHPFAALFMAVSLMTVLGTWWESGAGALAMAVFVWLELPSFDAMSAELTLFLSACAVVIGLNRRLNKSLDDGADEASAHQRTAARLHVVLDHSPNAIILIDAGNRIHLFNKTAARIFGYSQDEAHGADLGRLIVPERFRMHHYEACLRYFAGESRHDLLGKRVVVPGTRKDGTEVEVELMLAPLPLDDERLVAAFMRPLNVPQVRLEPAPQEQGDAL